MMYSPKHHIVHPKPLTSNFIFHLLRPIKQLCVAAADLIDVGVYLVIGVCFEFFGVNEAKAIRPRPSRGQMLKAKVKAEAMVSRPRPRPKFCPGDHFGLED